MTHRLLEHSIEILVRAYHNVPDKTLDEPYTHKAVKPRHPPGLYGPIEPYVCHPLRVGLSIPPALGAHYQVVGYLHDVVTETDVPLERLFNFGKEISFAIAACTRQKGESYGASVERAARNDIARVVKWFDLEDDCSPDRCFTPRLREKALGRWRPAQELLAASFNPHQRRIIFPKGVS